MSTGSFPGVKSSRGVTLTPQPLLVPWSWKSRAIPLPPYGMYGLYRASVPVQGCTLPLPLIHNSLDKIIGVWQLTVCFEGMTDCGHLRTKSWDIWSQGGLSNKAWPKNNKEESEMSWVKWWKEGYFRISRIHIKLYVTWKDPKKKSRIIHITNNIKSLRKEKKKKMYKKYGMI
jgi:hypothetical protein